MRVAVDGRHNPGQERDQEKHNPNRPNQNLLGAIVHAAILPARREGMEWKLTLQHRTASAIRLLACPGN